MEILSRIQGHSRELFPVGRDPEPQILGSVERKRATEAREQRKVFLVQDLFSSKSKSATVVIVDPQIGLSRSPFDPESSNRASPP